MSQKLIKYDVFIILIILLIGFSIVWPFVISYKMEQKIRAEEQVSLSFSSNDAKIPRTIVFLLVSVALIGILGVGKNNFSKYGEQKDNINDGILSSKRKNN